MGRAKLKMELIEKEKSRNITFKKRKDGLIRKLHEFTTLCDVNACMIIYGPTNHFQPEIFPSHNSDHVHQIIDLYKSKNDNNNNIKSSGIIDFFHDRKKQIEEEVAKLRRKNLEAKYPTRPELLNALSEPQLRQLHAQLTDKADHVKTLIDLLRGNAQPTSSMPPAHYSSAVDHRNRVDFGVMKQQHAAVEMLTDHHLMQRLPAFNHNHPMAMRQFDGGSTSANIQHMHQVFFEYAPLQQQYVLPPFPPQLQLPYMLQPAVVPPQYFANRDSVQEEFVQYHMRNNLQTARSQNLDGGEQEHEEFGVNNFFSY